MPRFVGFNRTLALAGVITLLACFDGPGSSPIEFDVAQLDLATGRDTVIQVRNAGSDAIGPIQLVAAPVMNSAGNVVSGPQLLVSPSDIATLNPGATRLITLSVDVPIGTPDDTYRVALEASVPNTEITNTLGVDFTVDDAAVAANVASISIGGAPTSARQGDVTSLSATATDHNGNLISDPPLQWTIASSTAGLMDGAGNVVGYDPGNIDVVAFIGNVSDTVRFSITPRGLSGSFTTQGQGAVTDRFTSDLWVHGSVAYTGTWGSRTVGSTTGMGNTLYVWSLADPLAPALTDSVRIDARVVNDVKIRSDGTLAVITHEQSNDGQNGVTLLDLADPLHPAVVARFTESLQTGVHNAWIDGSFVYLVVDGVSPTSGLRVLDVSNPANPTVAASYYAGSSFLHDVYVRDGLAFLSHWDAGLIILDVGAGIAGGSPDNPIEVSRLVVAGGQTHNAWYWPSAGYVIVGEEDFGTPGIMHVVDVRDLTRPKEVATFRQTGSTPHNFWLDESSGTGYLSWYEQGIRALDVTGDLMGELERQGREITGLQYGGLGGCPGHTSAATCNWAPQLHNGVLYLSDMNQGLVVLQLNIQ